MGRSGSTSVRALGLALALTTVIAGSAQAQSAEAEALFVEGDRLFSAGQIPEACDAFDASNRLEQRAGTLIRLGECREKQGRRASAWSAYRDALSRVRDPNKRKVAQDRVTALEPTLSQVTVAVPDTHRVVGLEVVRNGIVIDPVLWNRTVPIDGGEYTVVARAAGHVEQTQTVTIPAEGGKITIAIPRLEHVVVVVPDVPRQPDPVIQPIQRDPPSMLTGRRRVALGVGGVAVIAFVTGAVLGSSAKAFEDDAYLLCADADVACANADRANGLIARAESRSLYANVAFGVGVGAAIGAAVLWFTGAPTAEAARVGIRPTVAPDFVGASYGVCF